MLDYLALNHSLGLYEPGSRRSEGLEALLVRAHLVCLFRIAFALLSLLNALAWAPDALVWFGPRGVLPSQSGGLSLFDWLPHSDATVFVVLVL